MLHQVPDKMKENEITEFDAFSEDMSPGDISADKMSLSVSARLSPETRASLRAGFASLPPGWKENLPPDRRAFAPGKAEVLTPADGPETGRGAAGRSWEVPDSWTVVHVLDRLVEAYGTLAALPMKTRPKAYGNAMPEVVRERLPLIVESELDAVGELDQAYGEARPRRAVSAAQITRMDEAFHWPAEHLAGMPEVSRSLCLKALWTVAGADVARRCKARRMNQRFFDRQWQHGLAVITLRLIVRRVPVT